MDPERINADIEHKKTVMRVYQEKIDALETELADLETDYDMLENDLNKAKNQ